MIAMVAPACGDDAGPSVGETPARIVTEATLGPVSATLTMEPAEPRFGDRIHFVFEVRAEESVTLEPLEFGARLGHFRIRDRKDESQLEGRRLRHVITAEAEKAGTNIGRLPTIRFGITAGEGAGSERELIVPPFELEIAGLTPDQAPKLADLGAPLPPVSLPADPGSMRALWIAGGAVLLALALGLWWWRRRGRGEFAVAPLIDPAVEAARALDALLAAGLVEQGLVAEFYVRLTGIVRRFIERTTGVHAPEQTTEEFLRAMDGNAAFDPRRQSELSAFLAAADLVKFAAMVPSTDEIADSVAAARAFCAPIAGAAEVAA